MRTVLTTTFALFLLAAPPAADACSMAEGYKVPTTLELVQRSDAIVLARVGDAIPATDKFGLGQLILKPEALIAGSALPGELRITGYHGDDQMRAIPSDPFELARANPGAFTGGCNRYVFNRGMLLLLFLKHSETGQVEVIDASFARTLEDVPNADSLWVRAVRYYAGVARLPAAERKKAMTAEANRLRATGSRDDALLAADIARQIKRKRTQNYDLGSGTSTLVGSWPQFIRL